MKLGFNTSGNNQTSRRTTAAVNLGKLRNTVNMAWNNAVVSPSGKTMVAVGYNYDVSPFVTKLKLVCLFK